jgi:hypothetical protein
MIDQQLTFLRGAHVSSEVETIVPSLERLAKLIAAKPWYAQFILIHELSQVGDLLLLLMLWMLCPCNRLLLLLLLSFK